MAGHLPDVDLTTLTTSSQIFSPSPAPGGGSGQHPTYTLPQIRALHKQIHLAIDDKKARLRTQVGGSYRELLGTADAIVRMRGDMDTVQGILGTMGARCGRGVVGAKAGGLARFVEGRAAGVARDGAGGGARGLGAVARAKMLAACVLVLGRLLKGSRKGEEEEDGQGLVVAAKVLVLARLLVGRDLDEEQPDPQVRASVASSSQSLEKLRRRLRKSIDRVLGTVGETISRNLVLQALCAHSLAANSGARDVIRHFLDVRGNAMASTFDVEEQRTTTDVVRGLELYTQTILDVQALVPNKLAEALSSLKKSTLLSDPSLREQEGLRLDIYERWCSESIRDSRPTAHHDDLDGRQAVDMLTRWSARGSEVLLAGLEKTLARTTDFRTLTDMRTEVLQLWIRDGGKARGFDPSVMLGELRRTINAHVTGVLDAKVHKLRLVGSEIAATLGVWRRQAGAGAGAERAGGALWDVDALDMELRRGASPFAQDVVGRLYGRDDAVARAVTGYASWAQVIDDVEGVVERLRRQRWDNDVDEIEDEDTIDRRQQALSRDDPAALRERLDEALERAFGELDTQLAGLWGTYGAGEDGGHIAMYLLRTLRDVRARLPKLAAVEGFGLGMVPALQEKIASAVAGGPVGGFAEHGLAKETVVGRSLWEGDPELPTSPSPAVFRLLRDLTVAMSEAGTDLWSPSATAVLKRIVSKDLAGRWTSTLEARLASPEPEPQPEPIVAEEKPQVEGEETSPASSEEARNGVDKSEEAIEAEETKAAEDTRDAKEPVPESGGETKFEDAEDAILSERSRKDLLTQWLFDIAVLRCSISGSPEAADELKALEEAVWEEAGLEGTPARQRLHKASQDYWKRSSLLFGLLA